MEETTEQQFPVSHKAISASAGSGKTFQLIHRYVGILCSGVPPEKIIAMTFTRKAAGEIFDKVIDVLQSASLSADKAKEVTEQLHECKAVPKDYELTRDHARTLLRSVLENMHKCRIGTLDSFFVSVIQAFPFEFGFGGDLNILEGYSALAARQQTLQDILRKQQTDDKEQFTSFLESFKQATFGQEEKNFSESLDAFIEDYHSYFLSAPDGDYWANTERIWPEGCEWFSASDSDPNEDIQSMRKLIEGSDLPAKAQTKWMQFLDVLEDNFHPETADQGFQYIFTRIAPAVKELCNGTAVLNFYGKEWTPPPEVCKYTYRLLRYIMSECLRIHLQRTKGVYQILEKYERQYRESVRRQGNLTFGDVAFLLNSETLAQEKMASAPDKLYIDYRLDSHYDHWLIDEFQDTSVTQWQIIENLIDEILQDASGMRSFFYVGDVKQAIYRWRGGEPGLFDAILEKYNADFSEKHITKESLAKSQRSRPAVITAVNNVFDNLESIRRGLDDRSDEQICRVLERWRGNWQSHTARHTDNEGYAVLYSVPYEKGQDSEEKRFAVTADIIRRVNPLAKGLSVAALVRANKSGRNLVEYLRNQGIQASFEGDFYLLDNNFIATVASLLKLAQHPGDSFARKHVAMSPFNAFVPENNGGIGEFSRSLNEDIYNRGFEDVLRDWIQGCNDQLSEFERLRGRQLLTAAREFDNTWPSCRVTDFLDFLSQYQLTDPGTSEGVQVLTVHKAKGLQFDMVVLPAMDQNSGINTAGHLDLYLKRSDDIERDPEWLLKMPKKDFAETDPFLKDILEKEAVENGLEELCNLYVAMTRAKYGLYMVRAEPGPKSNAVYPSTILAAGLDTGNGEQLNINDHKINCAYEDGDSTWCEKVPRNPPTPPVSEPALPPAELRRRYTPRTPSSAEAVTRNASTLFRFEEDQAINKGTVIHKLLSMIEWWDPASAPDEIIRQAIAEGLVTENEAQTVQDDFKEALCYDKVQEALRKPSFNAEVWREHPVEVILNNEWVSACFDRVVIERDATEGQPVQATIIDFKTDAIESEEDLEGAVEMYKPQLRLYKRILSKVTGLSVAKIGTRLVFTTHGGNVDVPV